MKKKSTPSFRKCKVRIDLQKLETMRLTFENYGIEKFVHGLN